MITLNTIVYEGNFRKVLTDNSWFITFTHPLITKKLLTVNNLVSINEFKNLLINHPNIDVVYVSEHKDSVIEKYSLGINEETIGYFYTIPYFVSLETISTEFILNVASDCMDDIYISDSFILDSIKELDTNNKCSTTMVAWTKNNYVMTNKITIGKHENIETFKTLGKEYVETPNFNYSFGFTDQFFLGKVENLKRVNYNIGPDVSERIYNGPAYGGNSFEKRIVGHQVLNNVCNCIYKGRDYYIHDGRYY